MGSSEYLLAGQMSELERLKLQSRVWEPSGRRLLEEIGEGRGLRVADIGCGAMGWLRVLSQWVGPDGEVVGTDIDDAMLAEAEEFVAHEGLGNVVLRNDDLFATSLEPDSFDLVHARYEITPLGRGPEQMTTYLGLVRPGGTVVLEDPEDWDAGRKHLDLFRSFGIEATVRAEVLALPPGHPYLRLPLQFATALEARLLSLVEAGDLERLCQDAEVELKEPGRWGTTFTLLQYWGQRVA